MDITNPSATDVDNPFGTPDLPRQSVPEDLAAGSVVEVHGGPYTDTIGGEIPLGGVGTAAAPIFVRGASASNRPVFSRPVVLKGRYLIVENIEVRDYSTNSDSGIEIASLDHVAVRHCEVHNGPQATTSAVAISGSAGAYCSHIVLWDNAIHDNGDWQADFDQDHHGIGVFEYTDTLWVVDNVMYHNSGDGLQVNAGSPSQASTCHHIYIGRNNCYRNKQSGVWVKQAQDVVISQNRLHEHRPSDSSPGQGTGYQYGPDRVWFLFNDIYDCDYGIASGSNSGPGGDGNGSGIYIIGNLIHNIHHTTADYNPSTAWSNAAIMLAGGDDRHVDGNTIDNVDAGINCPGGGSFEIRNNIVSNVIVAEANHVFIEADIGQVTWQVRNNLFSQAGAPVRVQVYDTPYDVDALQTAFLSASGNLAADPEFFAASVADLRVRFDSPAVDAAAPSGAYATFKQLYGLDISVDVRRAPRPRGPAFDIGAFETR